MTGDYVAAAYRRYEETTPGTPEAAEARRVPARCVTVSGWARERRLRLDRDPAA